MTKSCSIDYMIESRIWLFHYIPKPNSYELGLLISNYTNIFVSQYPTDVSLNYLQRQNLVVGLNTDQ